MNNQQPLVTIAVPCYNQAQYLAEALNSVLAQTYQNWECVIANDGSTDNTEEVVKSYMAKDSRFKYVQQENQGPSAARNVAIRYSSGKYILPLDADDTIYPDYTSAAINVLEADNHVKIVYSEAEISWIIKSKWQLEEYDYTRLLIKNMIFVTSFFRRADFERVNKYDESIRAFEDWDLWIRILADGGRVVKLPQIYFTYRRHGPSNLQQVENRNNNNKLREYIYQKNLKTYIKVFGNPLDVIAQSRLTSSLRYKIGSAILFPLDCFRRIRKLLLKT